VTGSQKQLLDERLHAIMAEEEVCSRSKEDFQIFYSRLANYFRPYRISKSKMKIQEAFLIFFEGFFSVKKIVFFGSQITKISPMPNLFGTFEHYIIVSGDQKRFVLSGRARTHKP
jgi:hypothetical protein